MSILIVDNSQEAQEQLTLLLNIGGHFDLVYAQTIEGAFELLGITAKKKPKGSFDLILIDIFMAGAKGIEVCKKIKSSDYVKDIPLIVVTKNIHIESLLSSFEAGAVDYITKPLDNKIELLARVNAALSLKYEMDMRKKREYELFELTQLLEDSNKKLQQANKMLEALASVDELTKVANRRFFDEFFEREWRRAERFMRPISVGMMDIDFFKLFNDTYGHQRGDECLTLFATAIKDTLTRPCDLVARYGGEEFIILLPETDLSGAVRVGEIMRQKVAELAIPHHSSKVSDQVTFSMGISCAIPNKSINISTLIANADKALYKAKLSGRNRVEIFNPGEDETS